MAGSEGLGRGERLRHSKEFREVYEKGRRIVCHYFVAFVLARSEGPLRVGVVASRRVGSAVRRNRAKRILREVFRHRRPSREVSADLVLVARRALAGARYSDVDAAFARHVVRVLEKIP